MKIIFEKKVIIGSIFSAFTLIASVVAMIAVFFPDTLNLQKKKAQKETELTLTIKNDDDVKKLQSFMEKRIQDGKLFTLKLAICDSKMDFANSKNIYTISHKPNTESGNNHSFIDVVIFDKGKFQGAYEYAPNAKIDDIPRNINTQSQPIPSKAECADQSKELKYLVAYSECKNIQFLNAGGGIVYHLPIHSKDNELAKECPHGGVTIASETFYKEKNQQHCLHSSNNECATNIYYFENDDLTILRAKK